MATERQILANRANAQRSTGPKTVAGRLKSSRNAFRHGLSLPLRPTAANSAKVEAIALALTGNRTDERTFLAAAEVAQAQLELLRIRQVRAELAATLDLLSGDYQKLRSLAALDYYERLALTKRRRAAGKLRAGQEVPNRNGKPNFVRTNPIFALKDGPV